MHKSVLAGWLLLVMGCFSRKEVWSQNRTIANPYTITKEITATKGAVVSAHPLASRVGLEILQKGGNAVDAAIATQWALAVVYPGAGNIGGGGFMVARLATNKRIALDYREMAPGKAHKDMYLDAAGNAVAEKSLNGHLSGGVPGTVAGLFAAHQYAKLPMRVLIQPAIDLATRGFKISANEARGLNSNRDDFKKYSTLPNAFVKETEWKEGDLLVQKELAQTLLRIRDEGEKGFYQGKTAQLIVDEMQRGNGLISLEDLKNYKAKFRVPLEFDYRGYHVISMPMPSSGGLLLNQLLKMIEPFNISAMGFETPASVQLMTEVERRAYADRAKYMGDADFVKVPVETLRSDSYLKERMKDYAPGKAGKSGLVKPGNIPGYESEETTHLSVLDNEGNAVAVTTTLNNSYGSRTVIGGAGFILNDEMDDFSAKPGSPNLYGAVGGKANAIQASKRMLSAMSPTVVLKNSKPYLVAGTPGGTTIPTSVFQTIVDIIDFNMTPDAAVNKPKFHHQWLPDRIDIEEGFPESTVKALEAMGYKLYTRKQIGRTEVIKVLPDGKMNAVADHRGDDAAAGW